VGAVLPGRPLLFLLLIHQPGTRQGFHHLASLTCPDLLGLLYPGRNYRAHSRPDCSNHPDRFLHVFALNRLGGTPLTSQVPVMHDSVAPLDEFVQPSFDPIGRPLLHVYRKGLRGPLSRSGTTQHIPQDALDCLRSLKCLDRQLLSAQIGQSLVRLFVCEAREHAFGFIPYPLCNGVPQHPSLGERRNRLRDRVCCEGVQGRNAQDKSTT